MEWQHHASLSCRASLESWAGRGTAVTVTMVPSAGVFPGALGFRGTYPEASLDVGLQCAGSYYYYFANKGAGIWRRTAACCELLISQLLK